MHLQAALIGLSLAVRGTFAHSDTPRREHGLVGFGINAFQPRCAFACRDSFSGANLTCSTTMPMEGMDGMDGMDMGMVMTEPDCYATDDIFLQSLAYCISQKCKDESASDLEAYWAKYVPGTDADQPDPKESYAQALQKVTTAPTDVYTEGSLNVTSLVDEETWATNLNTDQIFGDQETMQEGYAMVIALSGVLIPIAFSLLRFVPFPSVWSSKFNAWVIEPPLVGSRHDTPIFFGLGQMPKRGQGLFIFYLIVINVVLSSVNYQYADPNAWYPGDQFGWMVMLVSNRLGLLSFANLPLVFLYAGRNNFLLWITNWSHSTFLLVHRWIAGISTLQAILHSLIYLYKYVKTGEHEAASKLPYWIMGVVATLGMTILFPTSIKPIRQKFYELFLIWHVFISILVVAGCYWHIVFEFSHAWGYELWIIVTMAVWGFDRIARMFRVARHGIRTAHITPVDDEYVRVTIPGVSTSGHAYLYFPTLTWRVWENHPFSVASAIVNSNNPSAVAQLRSQTSGDIEKQPTVNLQSDHESTSDASTQQKSVPQSAITFYIRTHSGLTSHLRSRTTVPVLLEAGYDSHSLVAEPLTKSPTLIALIGGVGITAALPHIRSHPGRVKLYWGCRTQTLVDDVLRSHVLQGVEQEIAVGRRLAITEILENELVGAAGSEVCVFVSGPDRMIDEVRNVANSIVRREKRVSFRLVVESFSW